MSNRHHPWLVVPFRTHPAHNRCPQRGVDAVRTGHLAKPLQSADTAGLTCDDVLMATTPISSSFQLVAALMPAVHVGASVGLVAGRSVDEIWSMARAHLASVLVAYPLTLADVVMKNTARKGDSPFRLALSGGSPLAPRIKRDYRDRLGIHLLESYGQSELGGFMAMGGERDGERALAGYVGRSLPDRLAYVGGPDGTETPPRGG